MSSCHVCLCDHVMLCHNVLSCLCDHDMAAYLLVYQMAWNGLQEMQEYIFQSSKNIASSDVLVKGTGNQINIISIHGISSICSCLFCDRKICDTLLHLSNIFCLEAGALSVVGKYSKK